MKNDVKLAKESWCKVLKHYMFIKNEINNDYDIFCDIIKTVQFQKMDDFLHASLSHEMLVISKHHRYDSRSDKVRIRLDNEKLWFEYFAFSKNYKNPDIVICEKNNYNATLCGNIKRLNEK